MAEDYKFKIVSDLLPPSRKASGRPAVYPWNTLAVGDSFWVPAEIRAKTQIAASAWKSRHPGWDYVSRREGAGSRIWRTS